MFVENISSVITFSDTYDTDNSFDQFIQSITRAGTNLEPGTHTYHYYGLVKHARINLPFILFDPLLDTETNKKILRQFHDDYLARTQHKFNSQLYIVDQARIWPRLHILEGKCYVFTRFGFFRDRIGRQEAKRGYRLVFTTNHIGGGSYGDVKDVVTIIPHQDTVQLQITRASKDERCVKLAHIESGLEDPTAEGKVLLALPYTSYRAKKPIRAIVDREDTLLLPQTKHAGTSLSVYNKKALPSEIISLEISILFFTKIFELNNLNIVHRDIKPKNVMIEDSNGQILIRLIDFGFSGFMPIKNPISLGTPGYMAPECQGGKLNYSSASDLYAAMVVLDKIFRGALKRRSLKDLPEASIKILNQVYLKGLSKDFRDRPSSAAVIQSLNEAKSYVDYHHKRAALPTIPAPLPNRIVKAEHIAENLIPQLSGLPIEKHSILICETLDKIVPDNSAFTAFMARLNIKCLQDCTSPATVKQTVIDLLNEISINKDFITTRILVLDEILENIKKVKISSTIESIIRNLKIQKDNLSTQHTLVFSSLDEAYGWSQLIKKQYVVSSITEIQQHAMLWLTKKLLLKNKIAPFSLMSYNPHSAAKKCLKELSETQDEVRIANAIHEFCKKIDPKLYQEFRTVLGVLPSVSISEHFNMRRSGLS